jgi:SAM-dependent methyltransferase
MRPLSGGKTWIRSASIALVLLILGWPALGQRTLQRNTAGQTVRQSMREYNFMAAKFVDALPLDPGDGVIVYGMNSPLYLKEFLRRVGPEGQVYAVFRSEPNYRYELAEGYSAEDPRVHPIFAADGHAHLEADMADLVVAMDLFGFFSREDALYREAHHALRPGGTLVQVRATGRSEAEYRQSHRNAPKELSGRPLLQEINRQRLGVSQHGFRYMDEIALFKTRTIRLFENLDGD